MTSTIDEIGHHTWIDVGGFLGLLRDGAFCAFVIVAALFMMLLATTLLALDYLASPVLKFISQSRLDNLD